MDSAEDGQQISSMVDDTFFIVKKSVRLETFILVLFNFESLVFY